MGRLLIYGQKSLIYRIDFWSYGLFLVFPMFEFQYNKIIITLD